VGVRDEAVGQTPVQSSERCRGQFRDGAQTRKDSYHIAVHQRCDLVEGNRGDSTSGVGTNSGDETKTGGGTRQSTSVSGAHETSTLVEHGSTAVVAETAPRLVHLIQRGGRQCTHTGPSRHPPCVVLTHRLDACLLQHHFTHPDCVASSIADLESFFVVVVVFFFFFGNNLEAR